MADAHANANKGFKRRSSIDEQIFIPFDLHPLFEKEDHCRSAYKHKLSDVEFAQESLS